LGRGCFRRGGTVNVAARVEQLTKSTGDPIALTQNVLDAVAVLPADLIDRGPHRLKGKAAAVNIFGLASTNTRVAVVEKPQG
jgi:adenylate cyclase